MAFVACNSSYENHEHFPSDYLFAQRSFPYGKIDRKAYSNAQQWRSEQLSLAYKNNGEDWEEQGPLNLDGRVTDIEVHPDNDNILYIGTASGGIFKSTNGGLSWQAIFDDKQSLSIGDLALFKENPSVIYAGTGESNAGGGSIAYDGNGVYRSVDGGTNWEYLGLDDCGSIGRIAVDSDDVNTVYVATMGHLFENNPTRGVFRTKDGGANWEQILYASDSTGAIDLLIHPSDNDILYAALWERIRKPHNRQYGGETSGIFRSMDGGDSWEELTNGLPDLPEQKGRIGLAISESEPQILYAYYAQSSGPVQGIYKTEDGGDTWQEKSTQGINNVPYMWWFGRIDVHPTDSDRLYATGLNMRASNDGSESWYPIFPGAHVDHHAIGFSRQDDQKIYNANDGGVYVSESDGISISNYLTGLGNFQFYACAIDPNDPLTLYGGAQDNGILRSSDGPFSWELLQGGDGFRIIVDPDNSQQLYFETQNGAIFSSSDGGQSINYSAIGIQGRSNWNTPLAMDPNDSNVLYTGTQTLYRSTDQARTWESISPSLVNDDNPPGNISFGTLTYIEVSPHDSNVIYIGTDDGNVWRTLDGGDTYENITSGLPERWVTSIATDVFDPEGVYITVSGFRFGDSDAQIFYSDDYGDNWQSISGNLPDIPINDVIVDDRDLGSLYIATDIGIYTTEDRGEEWNLLAEGIPNVPIIDLDYHSTSRTLAAASYGRGLFTLELPETSSLESVDTDLTVYPNPTTDFIEVRSEKPVQRLELYDLKGQLIQYVEGKHMKIDDEVSPGTYLLRMHMNGTFRVVKCIII